MAVSHHRHATVSYMTMAWRLLATTTSPWPLMSGPTSEKRLAAHTEGNRSPHRRRGQRLRIRGLESTLPPHNLPSTIQFTPARLSYTTDNAPTAHRRGYCLRRLCLASPSSRCSTCPTAFLKQSSPACNVTWRTAYSGNCVGLRRRRDAPPDGRAAAGPELCYFTATLYY